MSPMSERVAKDQSNGEAGVSNRWISDFANIDSVLEGSFKASLKLINLIIDSLLLQLLKQLFQFCTLRRSIH